MPHLVLPLDDVLESVVSLAAGGSYISSTIQCSSSGEMIQNLQLGFR